MSQILIINAHHVYPFSPGKLNTALTQLAADHFLSRNHEVRIVNIDQGWDVGQALADHQWADLIVLQSPINWMGVPWTFKQYMDEVYTAGMDGTLCHGDGRRSQNPTKNYGSGGSLAGKKYLLSVTFNAPAEAFGVPDEYLFQGKTVDDLLLPMHMNFRFFGMEALPTFACFDVMKNPKIEADFKRYQDHLQIHAQ